MKYEIIKGSEKDFDGAPEWATLKTFTGGCYFFVEHEIIGARVLDIARNDEFKSECDPVGVEIIAERRPITEPVWDGEGLMPSVGMKCLAKQCSQINADEFLVVAIQDGAVFGFWTATGAATGLDVNRWIFLPTPSPEDVARDEAKAAIAELCRSSASNGHSADLIYDAIAAGKIPGVKLEGK